jgi:predicted dehydrogenase
MKGHGNFEKTTVRIGKDGPMGRMTWLLIAAVLAAGLATSVARAQSLALPGHVVVAGVTDPNDPTENTPPTHLEMSKVAAELGVHVICQKPLASTFEEARQIVDCASRAGVRFMVHENWRFQPWYREIRRLLDDGAIGDRIHIMSFRSRMDDGWGRDAHLNRQPYLRTYPRLLVYENGVHFIDTYRYLGGEIASVYAVLKKLNPVIAGEDFAVVVFNFVSGATGLWDANRFNESNYPKPRYTFGEFLVDGSGGSIRLYNDARLTIQKLGQLEKEHDYPHEDRNFCGDCCYTTQRHFIDRLLDGRPFETSGPDYLCTLAVQDAVYESAAQGIPIDVPCP